MRNVIVFVVALGLVAAIFWWTRGHDDQPARPATVASGSQPAAAPATAGGGAASPGASPANGASGAIDTSRVRRLDRATRAELGAQIAAARERARAQATAAGEPFVEEVMKVEDVAGPLKQRLEETIPLLAECYPDREGMAGALAQMTLTSDPELGTVIDTDEIKDAAGQPLDAKLDACLRDTIDSLALPPLGPRGGKLPLQYTFNFSD